MKIIVTGGTGLLGQSLKQINNKYVFISSKDVDLTDRKKCFNYFKSETPHKIIHLAGKVGGIKDNSINPYSFISINNQINSNVIDYCVENNTPIIFASSSCVYPKKCLSYPMTEEMVNDGSPEETNDGYAYAKRFAGNMLKCASKQYKSKYSLLYFCNLYGEFDDFHNEQKSHLVTALIKKFHVAKKNKQDVITLMGTGNPMRQFLYATDAAKILDNIINQEIYGEYNVSTYENLKIKEIATVVAEVVGFQGKIHYDGNLDGVYRKDIDCGKLLEKINDFKFTSLRDGVEKVYSYYIKHNGEKNVEINA
jgi:GDP-L-fucose synthase